MAEFLHILSEQYDYPQLSDDIHRELSNKEFNSNDTKGPKSVSTFVAKLSELAPRIVIKQMTSVAKFMDSDVSFEMYLTLTSILMRSVIHPSLCYHRSLWQPDCHVKQ